MTVAEARRWWPTPPLLVFGEPPPFRDGERVLFRITPPDVAPRAGIGIVWLRGGAREYRALDLAEAGSFVVDVQSYPPGHGVSFAPDPTHKRITVRSHEAWMWETYRSLPESERSSWRSQGNRNLRRIYWTDQRRDGTAVFWSVWTDPRTTSNMRSSALSTGCRSFGRSCGTIGGRGGPVRARAGMMPP